MTGGTRTRSVAEPRVLILLRTIGRLEEGKSTDRWKLQKTIFLAELEMQKEGIGGLDYEFLRDKDGPMAPGIYEDMDLLMRSGFVSRDFDPKLTSEGRRFLESLEKLFESNREVERVLDPIIRATIEESSGALRQLTHEMEIEINGQRIEIDRLPPYYSILEPLSESQRKEEFRVPEDWQETIEILGDRRIREGLMSTLSRMSPSDFTY